MATLIIGLVFIGFIIGTVWGAPIHKSPDGLRMYRHNRADWIAIWLCLGGMVLAAVHLGMQAWTELQEVWAALVGV